MIEEVCARHPVKWWIVLGVLLVLLGVVQWVGAEITFDGTFETLTTENITSSPWYLNLYESGSSSIPPSVTITDNISHAGTQAVMVDSGIPLGSVEANYAEWALYGQSGVYANVSLWYYLNVSEGVPYTFNYIHFDDDNSYILDTEDTWVYLEAFNVDMGSGFNAQAGVERNSSTTGRSLLCIDDFNITYIEPEPEEPGVENTRHLFWKQITDDIDQQYYQNLSYTTGAEGGTFFEWQDYLHLLTYPNGKLYRSSNGNTWSLVNGWVAPFNTTIAPNGRFSPTIFSNETTMLVVGGISPDGSSDVWVSSDGLVWIQTTNDFTGFGITSIFQPNGIYFDNKFWVYNTGNSTMGYAIFSSDDCVNWNIEGVSMDVLTPYVYGDKVWAYSPVYNTSHDAFFSSTNGYSFILEYEICNFSPLFESNAKFPQQISTHTGFFEWDDIFWLLGTNVWEGIYSTDNLTSFWNDRNETYKYGTYYFDYPHVGESVSFFPYYPMDSSHPEMIYSYYGGDSGGGEIWVAGYFPQSVFSGTPVSGELPLTVTFTDESLNEPSSWYWVFGDGSTSTEQNPTHIYTTVGTYTVQLFVSNEYGNDWEVKTNYITVSDVENVALWGYVIDAFTNSTVSSASVAMKQGSTWHNVTSNTTGGYSFGDEFYTGISINASANKTGYDPWPVLFTIWSSGIYQVDLYVIPEFDDDVNETDAWIGGFVYDDLWYQGVAGATVNIWNDTWSDTNITNGAGFYLFTNLTNTTYNFNATALSFDNSLDYNTTAVYGNFTQLDIPITPNYQIDLTFKDENTHANIYQNVTVVFEYSNGTTISETNTTSATWSSGLIDYGMYNLTASSVGYYPSEVEISLYSNITDIVYLTPIEDFSGANTNYVPHPVRFTYVDAYGNPITGATVTATALESSNPWSWLEGVFGYRSTVDIEGTVLSGNTGSDGTISFLMVETVQYRVHCVKTTAGINHTVDIYPKESEYFIRIGALPSVGSDYPTYSLNATIAGTNVILFGNYTDTSGHTTSARFIVTNSSGSEVYNTSITLTGGVGSAYYAVNNTKGDQYTFGLVAEHSTQGTIEKWIDITLKGSGRLIDFGEGWTDFMYLVMSVACIFLVAGCFGEMDVRLGAFFIPLMGGVFWWIGWMPETYGALISIAGFLGGIYYLRSKAGEMEK